MQLPPNTRCLVTGASDPSSVGYACAKALVEAGAFYVVLMGRDLDKVKAAVASLQQTSQKCILDGVVGDLKQPQGMKQVIQEAATVMDGGLDILVISGGNGGSEYLGMDAANLDSYRAMYDISVLSPLELTEAAIPYLSKSPAAGSVVMVSSMAAQTPWPDTAPYNYAKAAQNSMIETLAFKYRTSNVRINGVLPACIHTGALDRMAVKKNTSVEDYAKLRGDAHPMGRNGTPADVANAVVFLASPASSFTTGELLKVDGGLHLSNWFNKPRMLAEFQGGTD